MQDVPTDTKQRMPSSQVLEEVIHQAPAEYVTVGWLTSTLHQHSFGIIKLKPDLLPVLADRGAISFRNVGTKSTPHPAEIVPKRDAHHILTPGYVKIILWLEYSL
jgi:hypothetical protein